MILDDFIEIINNAIYGDSITTGGWVAIGTGTTAATGSDTTLETELDRKTCANSKPSADTTAFASTWATTEANSNMITEVGVVNAASGGVFLNRQVFPGFNKTDDYELRVQVYVKSANN